MNFREYMEQANEIERNKLREIRKIKKPLIETISNKCNIQSEDILYFKVNTDCCTFELYTRKLIPLKKFEDDLKITVNTIEESTRTFFNDYENEYAFKRYIYIGDIDYDY